MSKKLDQGSTNTLINTEAGKRLRSSEEIVSTNKREKLSSNSSVDLMSQSNTEVHKQTDNMTDEEFIAKLAKALADNRVRNQLQRPILESLEETNRKLAATNTKLEETTATLAEVKETTIENKQEIEQLKTKIDEYEQRDIERHAIVSGTFKNEETSEGITELLNKNMTAGLHKEDIEYVLKLGKKDAPNKRFRIVFKTAEKKAEIMKKKKNLKGKNVWLSEHI